MEAPHTVHPAALAPGALVGPWRLLALASQGSYGVVFRAEPSARPEAGTFALKLALQPGDARFALEVELLSRTHHPNVPRLHDSGEWSGPGGALFPFLVMDWVEGLPLYAWARLQPRSSRELLRVLAQAASALQAVHAAGGIHRDVKGDHLLVRPEDGHAMLVDFGSCTFRGAPVLTRRSEPPGTPHYQSPQAQLHQWKYRHRPGARYEFTAADDVYSLGVAAYRLAAGRYPLIAEELSTDTAQEELFSHFPELVPAEALVQLSPGLARWLRQLLSVQPEARGTMAELAVGLALAAKTEGREADRPIGPREAAEPAEPWAVPPPARQVRRWQVGLLAMAMGMGLGWVAGGGSLLQGVMGQSPSAGDTASVGEGTLTEARKVSEPTSAPKAVSTAVPAGPLAGQRLPPCKGPQIEINGGCWILVGNASPPCIDTTYEWRKRCYVPFANPSRPSTSTEK